jgi:hypothetical protein
MVLAPESLALLAQPLLVDFADPFQHAPHLVEVTDLLADPSELGGMEADLARFAPRIADVQHPLEMALALVTGGAGDRFRMEGMTFEQGAPQDRVQRRKRGQRMADTGGGAVLTSSHLYR